MVEGPRARHSTKCAEQYCLTTPFLGSDGQTTTEASNTFTGSYSGTTTASDRSSDHDAESDAGLSDSSSLGSSDSPTTQFSGNSFSGADDATTTATLVTTDQDSGTDARGSFSSSLTSTDTVTTRDNGNDLSGSDGVTQTIVHSSVLNQSGGDGSADYSETVSDAATTTTQDNGNDDSGADTTTTTTTDGSTLQETGGYQGVSYALQESDSSSTTEQDTADDYTGSNSSSTIASASSSLQETGSSSGGSYSLIETVSSGRSEATTGDDLTGSYAGTFAANSTTTTQEASSHAGGSASFTETVTDASSGLELGNAISGDFSSTGLAGSTTTTLQDSGSDTGGSFSVGETDTASYSGDRTGNDISGSYTEATTSSDSYTMTERGAAYSLGEVGSQGMTTQESGNTVTGAYSRGETGSDSYGLTETGTQTAGSFSEAVQGSDTYTLTETGNHATQEFARTTTGSGTYARQDSGPGSTLPSNNGSLSYTVQETGDWRAGLLSQSETGSDRYSLLEFFDNVANTGSATAPGHLNFSPVGMPFSDAPPAWFKKYANQDGQIEFKEWRVAGLPIAEFEKIDVNGDGFITPEEMEAYLKKHPGYSPTQGTAAKGKGGSGSPLVVGKSLSAAKSRLLFTVRDTLLALQAMQAFHKLHLELEDPVDYYPYDVDTDIAKAKEILDSLDRDARLAVPNQRLDLETISGWQWQVSLMLDGARQALRRRTEEEIAKRKEERKGQPLPIEITLRSCKGAAALLGAIPLLGKGSQLLKSVGGKALGSEAVAAEKALPLLTEKLSGELAAAAKEGNQAEREAAEKLLGQLKGMTGCFAAGTPLLAPGGSRRIEEFREGDAILSADEFAPSGAVEVKRVVRVYRQVAGVLRVRVGGQALRMTGEHPVYVDGHGWVKVYELRPGQFARSHDGGWVLVEGVEETGEVVPVYNLEVSDYHTFFVGGGAWGFSVWVHNTNVECLKQQIAAAENLLKEAGEEAKPELEKALQKLKGDLAEAERVAAPKNAKSILDQLPGKTGKTGPIKEVPNEQALKDLFDTLSKERKTVNPGTYPGVVKELPDGTIVRMRPGSRSGGATLDITMPDGKIYKVHIQ